MSPWGEPRSEGDLMRWEALFADLEGQLDAKEVAELDVDVAERTQYELGRLRLADRLCGAAGRRLVVTVAGVGTVEGDLAEVGSDWLLVREQAGRDAVIPVAAVGSVGGLSGRTSDPEHVRGTVARLGLRRALRGLARDRGAVIVALRDGGAVTGTIDTVGADFIEVAEHPPGELRRASRVRSVRAIALGAIGAVRSA
jgi:hypothetical protein